MAVGGRDGYYDDDPDELPPLPDEKPPELGALTPLELLLPLLLPVAAPFELDDPDVLPVTADPDPVPLLMPET